MASQSDGGKSQLTRIKNNNKISSNLIHLLYQKNDLSQRDAEFLFSVSLIFIEEYQKDIDKNKYLLIEYAYFIIALTCFKINDFRALYDFSANYGFFPIARKILNDNLIENQTINHLFSNIGIENYVEGDKVKTLEQNKVFKEVLSNDNNQVSFIAPTSYGKSELIFKHLENNSDCNFAGIIVPTKALIDQTFRESRKKVYDRKIIIHDQNFDFKKDKRVLAIVTQERALRLIEEGLFFDILYIDEAHELLSFNHSYKLGNRSLLLARVIQLSRKLKENLKIVYLSPTVQEVDNLVLNGQQPIESYKIEKNLKILGIRFLNEENKEFIYDRFLNEFIEVGVYSDSLDYIKRISQQYQKNLHFLYRPKYIESYAESIYLNLPDKEVPEEIKQLCEELKQVVHPNFKLIKYLSKGIIYMHGKLPLMIRNYLLKYVRESYFLQNFIANSVVLAGMNLPIDNLIYISGFNKQSDLHNLIGRVNRLNEIFKNNSKLSKLFIPIHFVEMQDYPQNPEMKLKNKIEGLRNKPKDNVKNPILKNSERNESNQRIIENEKRIIENYSQPDFITRLNKAGAQQLLNYTDVGLEKIENILMSTEKVDGYDNLYQKILYKIKEVFFDSFVLRDKSRTIDENYFLPTNNAKRLRFNQTIEFYVDFLDFSFKSMNERVENLFQYWQELLSRHRNDNVLVYVGTQFGEVPYETESYQGIAKVYVNLREHAEDIDYLYNLAIIKIQTDEDFIGHEITLLLNTLKEFEVISDEQFNYFLYRTFNEKELAILRLGISKNIYLSLKEDYQIGNIIFDNYGNAKANSSLRDYINSKSGIERFELEQYFI